jgi:hypothetical protein
VKFFRTGGQPIKGNLMVPPWEHHVKYDAPPLRKQPHPAKRGSKLPQLLNRNIGPSHQYLQIDFNDLKPTKLFVENILFSLNREKLKDVFRKYDCPILEAVICRSRKGSRGCGHVVSMSSSQAEKLLNTGGQTVQNRKIGVHPFSPDWPVVKVSVGPPEHSFHAHKPDSTEQSVPIPLLNEDEVKYSRRVRTAQIQKYYIT